MATLSEGALVDAAGDDLMGHEPSDRFGFPSDAVRAAFIKWQQAVEALNEELRVAYVKWHEGIEALGPNPLHAAPVSPAVEVLPTANIPLVLAIEQ